MANILTQEDLLVILQHSACPKNNPNLVLKIEVLNLNDKIIGQIEDPLVGGTMSIDSESDVRRTSNFVIQPTLKDKIKLSEDSLLWINKDIKVSVGLYNIRTKKYQYYSLGRYVYVDSSSTYDATTNNLSINCADFMKKLDGTKNGQLGSLIIRYPAYEENSETGEVLSYNIIRDAVIETLEKLCRITKYRIDDIGEYKALPDYNEHWQQYREENITWNAIPYDLEFSCGCSVLSILTTLRDLYPNYEMFFDMDTNDFINQLRPMCYDDDLFLDNSFLQKVLISENTSVDITTVRNICEVWGRVLESDYYSEQCTYTNNVYTVTIPEYKDKYYNGDKISIKISAENQSAAKLNINSFGSISIYNEATDQPISENIFKKDQVYTFKIKKKRVDKQDVITAYIMGQWQVHALNVLTDGTKSDQIVSSSDGQNYTLYSKEYFQKFYNCDRVDLTIVPDSPFTVEKLGEILDVKTGNEYENITSDDLAADRAKWENWKNCRLTDNITITTALLPFIDVNKKVSYQRSDSETINQYIITSVSHDFENFTSKITMYRFYPLYETIQKMSGSHRVLSKFSNGVMSKYTNEDLNKVMHDAKL